MRMNLRKNQKKENPNKIMLVMMLAKWNLLPLNK
jgi:hypothetical protein